MKLSDAQQYVIDGLGNGQRLLCLEHTSVGLFAGKLYNGALSLPQSRMSKATLKALVSKGLLTERSREVWHKGDNWTMYKIEYKLAER